MELKSHFNVSPPFLSRSFSDSVSESLSVSETKSGGWGDLNV